MHSELKLTQKLRTQAHSKLTNSRSLKTLPATSSIFCLKYLLLEDMKQATFSNGDTMPLLGLGTWKSEDQEAYRAVRSAIRLGYRHFDCAARYENEAEIGQALADAIADGEVTREELWITSKLWNNCHRSEDVLPALRQTLEDLRLAYLDLYLIHWPVVLPREVIFPADGSQFVPLDEVPIIETWRQMEAGVNQGLTRHIGVSNFSIKKLKSLLAQCSIRPASNQVECHPYLQQSDLLAYCQQERIWITAYSPLGSMDRPARLIKEQDPILLHDREIAKIAEAYGVTPAQILIAWAVNRATAVIPKSANPERQALNLKAGSLSLSRETMDRIDSLDRHFRYIDGTIWTPEGSPYTLANLWDEG